MKTLTIEDIRDLEPCYDPTEYLPEDWSGTVLDILDIKDCSLEDRLWVVTFFLSDKVNRLFAVYCARQAIALVENPDERVLEAVEVAERFALGKATKKELAAARVAADAVWAAASGAASGASVASAVARATSVASASDAASAAYAARTAARTARAAGAAEADFECYLRLLIGHGAGFWDGDYKNGGALTELCEKHRGVWGDKLIESIGE